MRRRAAMLLGAAWAVAFTTVLLQQPVPPQSLAIPQAAPFPTSITREGLILEDVSLEWGITLAHQQTTDRLSGLDETLGSGACIIDVDRDGWMDLFFIGGTGHTQHYGRKAWWQATKGNRLLLNLQGKAFEDATDRAGIRTQEIGMGCAVADLDNDGFQDLIVTGLGGTRVLKNNGDRTFADVTADSGLEQNRWSTGMSVADFNRDGLLDIYVGNYILFEKHARRFERRAGFRPTVDPAFEPNLYDPEPNRLYVNLGNFRFRDEAARLGVSNSLGRSLGARWFDMNDDRWPDLLVINDHPTPNQVFMNDRGKVFLPADSSLAILEVAGAHDLAIADLDGDGKPEFFMSQAMGRPPALLSSTGQSGYADVAWSMGIARSRLLPFSGWGTAAADFDNDGWVDLYVANGSVLPDPDSPYVPQAQSDRLFSNDGDGHFAPQSAGTSNRPHPFSSRGAIPVDLDNDGRLELIVTNNNDVMQILETSGGDSGNWLTLDLSASHRDSQTYGAKLAVQTELRTLHRALWPAQSFLSQGDPRIHVGLGRSTKIKLLRLDWGDGTSSVFNDVPINQHLSIDRESNELRARTYPSKESIRLADALGPLNDSALLSLARIALRDPGEHRSTRVLAVVWREASPQARVSILNALTGSSPASHLALIRAALLDQAPDVRRRAVEILRDAELESSVAWLIPLLQDHDSGVVCAVAETFRFFFDEEEAVTQRKRLAVRPLIQLLESGSPETRICSANALAAAESKRAIQPLIRQAESHDHTGVRVASIRALGLIRDRNAQTPLRTLASNPSETPSVVASSLIALHRLDDPSLDQLFDRILSPSSDAARHRRVGEQDVLAELFATPDGIVFSRSDLQARFLRILAKGPRADSQKETSTTEQSDDDSSTVVALVALALLDTPPTRETFENLMFTQPPPIVYAVVGQLQERGHTISRRLLEGLVSRSDNRIELAKVLAVLPQSDASRLFDSLLRAEHDEALLLALLDLCSSSALGPLHPNGSLLSHPTENVRLRYAQCVLRRNVPLDPKARAMLLSILSDTHWSEDSRVQLMINAAELDEIIARTLLSRELPRLPEKWLLASLSALGTHGSSFPIDDFLWGVLEHQQFPADVRLQAGAILLAGEGERVRNYVYGRFLQ